MKELRESEAEQEGMVKLIWDENEEEGKECWAKL